MYLKHFGLNRFPFDRDIAAEDMFQSQSMAELSVRLQHLVELRGIGLVTGDAGSGKSSACRRMASTLHSGLYKTLYVPLSTGNPIDLYKCIAWELGLPTERSRAALYKQIRSEVTRLCLEARMKCLLIVDEAHALRSEVLEELRLLTNYAMDSENRLCLLLCGQTELRRRVAMAVHEPLNQRIVVRYQLGALNGDESPAYLGHLLKRAGTELPLFESQALCALHQASSGLPRKLNLFAHHALIAAAAAKAKAVTAEHVQTAMTECA
jgi:type II secretory pathway predicted ATPase ExeA